MVPTPKRQSKTARGPDRGEPEGPRAKAPGPWPRGSGTGAGPRPMPGPRARVKGPPGPRPGPGPAPGPPGEAFFSKLKVCLWLRLREARQKPRQLREQGGGRG